ncbi:DUF190 domain-containing protein [Carboxylicivirga caseinilyticus]|uniref:DUF190 domain-containing protein n=1 Tax=Carboxylicivirga caseinilyticus TaxID=3417572 RepID=UPI003D34B820|nr:DUF190 domain-containing protein [Marinilabiliaceae bacterium A049]
MVLDGDAKKLKIIVSEEGIVYQRSLYEAILFAAKKYKIAGATAHKGILSYGADDLANNAKAFSLPENMPVIIEMVDREERIYDFAEIVSKLIDKSGCGGIVYVESVDVVTYKKSVC